ncbi:unnamed protein product [Anisakis simplex]|uniref:Vacuolar protein sorting-associated protein 33A (inferred by orthology to a C. elegans protein) n=1 Tax=Anisakis simplex TaxID=6269 RepID=A0A0M3K7C0_ANISI|nr:unnamed protein product [Anisakis simplex]
MEPMTSTQNVNGYQTVCDFNRNLFLEALDSYHGAKVIVWEQTLMTPFSMVIGASKLKQRKVVAMYDLNDCGAVSSIEHNHVIYIISATFIALKKLIAHLHSILALHFQLEDTRLHHVLFVPDATLALRDRLEEHREINSMLASVEPLPIRIYTLYDDVFTLLMEHTPAKLLINNDWTELHKCACALRQLEQLSVSLPNIRCKGKWSAQITEIINKMRNDANENEDASKNDPKRINISDIIIIDRWVDPLTPMLMQHTYAENCCNFPFVGNLTASFFPKKDGSEGDAASTTRSLRDEIFVKLRDLHISNIGKSIADTVTEIRTEKSVRFQLALKEFSSIESMTERKVLVRKVVETDQKEFNALKEFSSIESMTERKVLVRKVVETDQKEFNVRIHTAIAEHLMNTIRDDPKMSKFLEIEMNIIRGVYGERVIPFVEDLILCAFQASCVLRFIALQCLTYGGLKPNTYTAYLRLFVQVYLEFIT